MARRLKLPTEVSITAKFEGDHATVSARPFVNSISPDQFRAIARACERWAERRESGELPSFGEIERDADD